MLHKAVIGMYTHKIGLLYICSLIPIQRFYKDNIIVIFSASSHDELHLAAEHVVVVDHDLDVVDAVLVHARSDAWFVGP